MTPRTTRYCTLFIVAIAAHVFAASAAAQGAVRWTAVLPSAAASDVATEGDRVFVAGNIADASGNSDLLVRSFDATSGALLWQDRLDVAGRFDEANAIAVHGGIVVAGGRVTNAARNRDAFVRAYDALSGSVLWQNQFNFVGRTDEFTFHTITIGEDAVFLGGLVFRTSSNAEWFVRAYALTTGAVLWQDVFDTGSFDHPVSIATQGSRVFAGGVTTDSSFIRHFTVRGYDAATGTLAWQDRVPIGSVGFFFAADVAWELAAEGNRLFAAGSISDATGLHWAVRAYDVATGDLRWNRLDDFGAGADVAFSVDASGGRVYVTGSGGPNCSVFVASDCDMVVRAYSQQTGDPVWEAQLDGVGGDDQGNAVRVAGRSVLVAAVLATPTGGLDWFVQSFDARTGALEWSDHFASPGEFAYPNQVVLSGSRAFVTGYQAEASGVLDQIVRAYDTR